MGMDLYKLGTSDIYNNPYLRDALVEGWSSLIWTERYTECGDFQLKTLYVSETLDLIPDGSLVGIDESQEIMRVETHSIAVNDEGVTEATITGRSFETFLENRIIKSDPGAPYPLLLQYKVQDAIGVLIYNSLSNPTAVDVTGGPEAHDPGEDIGIEITVGGVSPIKAPSTAGEPDVSDRQSVQDWYVENGDVYKFVLDWLKIGELGIRVTRPWNDVPTVFAVAENGAVSYPSGNTENLTALFHIYGGKNRSLEISTVDPQEPVIFRYDAGHLQNPNYLFSKKGYKNWIRTNSSEGIQVSWNGDDGYRWVVDEGPPLAAPTGLDLYQMYLDLGQIDPTMIMPGNSWQRQQAKIALKNHNRQIMIDAAVSPVAPYAFGSDYYLGDFVAVMGEYNVSETMQVNEYVRSQDKDGYKGYPTLIRRAAEY